MDFSNNLGKDDSGRGLGKTEPASGDKNSSGRASIPVPVKPPTSHLDVAGESTEY